jgi:hypothetical protein
MVAVVAATQASTTGTVLPEVQHIGNQAVPPLKIVRGGDRERAKSRAAVHADSVLKDLPALNVRDRMRIERAKKQRAERQQRPNKLRGAHSHPALRSELPTWWGNLPQDTLAACNEFDHRHVMRWNRSETMLLSIQRDV